MPDVPRCREYTVSLTRKPLPFCTSKYPYKFYTPIIVPFKILFNITNEQYLSYFFMDIIPKFGYIYISALICPFDSVHNRHFPRASGNNVCPAMPLGQAVHRDKIVKFNSTHKLQLISFSCSINVYES